MSSMPNFTVQRRSDRGYSSDVDTLRPTRGSNAGGTHQGNPSNASGNGMRGRGGRGRSNNTRFHSGEYWPTLFSQRDTKNIFINSLSILLHFLQMFLNVRVTQATITRAEMDMHRHLMIDPATMAVNGIMRSVETIGALKICDQIIVNSPADVKWEPVATRR